jgi:hypothetical protein
MAASRNKIVGKGRNATRSGAAHRRQIADEVERGSTIAGAAREFKVTKALNVNWALVDWSMQNCEISAKFNVSRQRVSLKRKALGQPDPVNKGMGPFLRSVLPQRKQVLEWLETHPVLASLMSCPQIEKYLGIRLDAIVCERRKEVGRRTGITSRVNWDLPSADINRIWSMCTSYAANLRHTAIRRPPAWKKERGVGCNAPGYAVAIAAEEAKIQQLRKDILAEAEGRSEDLPASVRRWL